MCGIVGIVGPVNRSVIYLMNQAQYHRGPDSSGIYTDPTVELSLGMRRLAIIDRSDGHQPMKSSCGQYVLVYNGELFNAPELRVTLERCGYVFTTHHSDTEVVLNSYIEWGPDSLRRFNGMFSFVVYDMHNSLLFGARDPLGIKPLHYYSDQSVFAFASEIKSLQYIPSFSPEINIQSLCYYLSLQYIPSPFSIYTGVRKLLPGEHFTYDLRSRKLHIYPASSVAINSSSLANIDEKTYLKTFDTTLNQAVNRWLTSDVGVASSLSGGLDSGIVTALASINASKPINTITVGFANQSSLVDEMSAARALSQLYSTNHTEILLTPEELLDDLPEIVRCLDEPYGGGIPSWYVYKSISSVNRVILTGIGGDELFGNYNKWLRFSPLSLHFFKALLRKSLRFELSLPLLGCLYPQYFTDRELSKFFHNEVKGHISIHSFLNTKLLTSTYSSYISKLTYLDLQLQLPDEFLSMTDLFSMHWSVEARTPLLDQELMKLVFSFPENLRVNRQIYKYPLTRLALKYLPSEYTTVPKSGFILPLRNWFTGRLKSLVYDVFSPSFLRQQGIFSQDIFHKYIIQELNGNDFRLQRIWTLFMFQLWWKYSRFG